MYTVQKQRLNETLELKDENGDTKYTITVNFSLAEACGELNKAKKELLAAQENYQKTKNAEVLGAAVVTLFNVIFGENNTKTIVDFYENRYTEMIMDLYPFITEVVYPKIRELQRSKLDQIKLLKKRAKK